MAHGRHAGSVIFKIGDWEGLAISCCGSVTPLTSKIAILVTSKLSILSNNPVIKIRES